MADKLNSNFGSSGVICSKSENSGVVLQQAMVLRKRHDE
jgi:hypothetical protein